MTAKEIWAQEARDKLHNLDIDNTDDHTMEYDKTLKEFIISNEGFDNEVYRDRGDTGYRTIGCGFNMDATDARKIWLNTFQGTIDFDDALSGAAKLNDIQVNQLLDNTLKTNRNKVIEPQYGSIWKQLKANERLAIEDLAFLPSLIKKGTKFHKYIHEYAGTGEKQQLCKAVVEIRDRSNANRNDPVIGAGIQNRRNVQAIMLESFKCPVYSKPGDDVIPSNLKPQSIPAIPKKTIVPRIDYKENFERYLRHGIRPLYATTTYEKPGYYIWRTCCDNRVRSKHAEREGKIFHHSSPPDGGIPGEEYGCRCNADWRIPAWIGILG